MCNPMAMAGTGFAIQGAQALLGFGAAKQQAEETNRNSYLQGIYNNLALAQTYNSLQRERVQARDAASQSLFENRIRARIAEGTARTAAGEAGVDGSVSADAVLQDYEARLGRGEAAVRHNYEAVSDNVQDRMTAAYTGTQARNASLPQVKGPNFGDALLRIAGAGFNAAGNYYGWTNQKVRLPQVEGSV